MRKYRSPNVRPRASSNSSSAPSRTTAARKSRSSRPPVKIVRVAKSYVLLDHAGERIRWIGRFHFLVRSKSEPGWHCVDLGYVNREWPEGGCTCDGFSARKTCRHWKAVWSLLGL